MDKRLTTKDVMKIYGVSAKTIWVWKRDLAMPCRHLGGKCYFVHSELEDWEKVYRTGGVDKPAV